MARAPSFKKLKQFFITNGDSASRAEDRILSLKNIGMDSASKEEEILSYLKDKRKAGLGQDVGQGIGIHDDSKANEFIQKAMATDEVGYITYNQAKQDAKYYGGKSVGERRRDEIQQRIQKNRQRQQAIEEERKKSNLEKQWDAAQRGDTSITKSIDRHTAKEEGTRYEGIDPEKTREIRQAKIDEKEARIREQNEAETRKNVEGLHEVIGDAGSNRKRSIITDKEKADIAEAKKIAEDYHKRQGTPDWRQGITRPEAEAEIVSGAQTDGSKFGTVVSDEEWRKGQLASLGEDAGRGEKHGVNRIADERASFYKTRDELEKAGNTEGLNALYSSLGDKVEHTAAGIDAYFAQRVAEGPTFMDHMWGNKIPQVGAGVIGASALLSMMNGKGKKTNAELYSNPF